MSAELKIIFHALKCKFLMNTRIAKERPIGKTALNY